MRSHLTFLLLVWFVVAMPEPLFADSWAPPKNEVAFSPSKEFFVLVIPGKGIGKKATAELYQRHKDKSYQLMKELTLVTPEVPVKFYISDKGYWVTLDNWGKMGYGKVVVFYDFKGQPIKSYRLADLFNEKEIKSFMHSISSIHWRQQPSYINPNQKTLHVSVNGGGTLSFKMKTGAYRFCEYHGKKFVCRTKNQNRKWVPFNPN